MFIKRDWFFLKQNFFLTCQRHRYLNCTSFFKVLDHLSWKLDKDTFLIGSFPLKIRQGHLSLPFFCSCICVGFWHTSRPSIFYSFVVLPLAPIMPIKTIKHPTEMRQRTRKMYLGDHFSSYLVQRHPMSLPLPAY